MSKCQLLYIPIDSSGDNGAYEAESTGVLDGTSQIELNFSCMSGDPHSPVAETTPEVGGAGSTSAGVLPTAATVSVNGEQG